MVLKPVVLKVLRPVVGVPALGAVIVAGPVLVEFSVVEPAVPKPAAAPCPGLGELVEEVGAAELFACPSAGAASAGSMSDSGNSNFNSGLIIASSSLDPVALGPMNHRDQSSGLESAN
jgi:hypothetical protein